MVVFLSQTQVADSSNEETDIRTFNAFIILYIVAISFDTIFTFYWILSDYLNDMLFERNERYTIMYMLMYIISHLVIPLYHTHYYTVSRFVSL